MRARLMAELTFIILARPEDVSSASRVSANGIEQCRMVGDVNLFLDQGIGECEIMIASAFRTPRPCPMWSEGVARLNSRTARQTPRLRPRIAAALVRQPCPDPDSPPSNR